MSPKTTWLTPSALARAIASAIADSYASFEQGAGMSTGTSGSPMARAWASTNSRRTPCIELR